MKKVLINGLKAKTGGGKSILNNYLELLRQSDTKYKYFVLTPRKSEYVKYSCDFIEIIEINSLYKKNFMFPALYHILMPRLLRSYKIDFVFNLGDIIIPAKLPQLYLFDWAYAVYPNSIVWKRMDSKDYLTRKIKMLAIRKYIKYATVVIAQTKNIKERLESLYGLKNVVIVPNAVSLESISGGEEFDFNFEKNKTNLLYLANYSSHKNIEVLVPLARKIKDLRLPYRIVITIDRNHHKLANKIVERIEKDNLENIIFNVGSVKMKHVPSLYQQCDALLMPTLLESYGLPYLEAMHQEKTILTSDLDFARDVCGDAAFYFDPLDIDSILSAISYAFENRALRIDKIEKGRKQLTNFFNWDQVFCRYQALLEDDLGRLIDIKN